MSFAKKVSQGVMSAALGLSLIGGGTFAYFSDTVETQNTFAAGTLDLGMNPSAVVNISNIKPGDEVYREFTLENNGTLPIGKVLLNTKYTVADAMQDGQANTDDLAKHIKVTIMYNTSSATNTVVETTLHDLQTQQPDLTEINTSVGPKPDGIPAGEKEKIFVLFEFVDNGENQNQFQGDKLQVNWTFNAQTESSTYHDDTDPNNN
ncbi:cell division protein FtsN [Sporosarcina globispora]|uniref:Cell division protein FtsN n=1 Tax=Sporosarcina globispora TaxID=1459 RepID=A0A0M0G7X6_SPOGL|nr:TasA family protein [Sporosarcina globispora]KON85990.1 cell division protein FtsN [Sporosarcina globispora]